MNQQRELDPVRINIELPLPLEVVGALTSAVGAMWPTAQMRTDSGRHLRLEVPAKSPRKVSDRTFRKILAETIDTTGEGPEVALARWDGDEMTMALNAKDEAWQQLAAWALICLTADAAPNYVEQMLRFDNGDGGGERTAVVCAAWSGNQTPHQMRQQAVAELEQVRAERDQAVAEVERLSALLAAGRR